MRKINSIKAEQLIARKEKNILAKNLLSTFIGEYQAAESKQDIKETEDDLVHLIAKKMIKSAKVINTNDANIEISILEKYLPSTASIEEVKAFLYGKDLSIGGRLIGLAKKHFNGNVEPSTVNEAIKQLS